MIHYTRFRAYQLGVCGASFSFSVNNHFTLIEARYNDVNKEHILWEMKERCGLDRIDVLHITSWDKDHCQANELQNILTELRPRCIEYPCYEHNSDNYHEAIKLINNYKDGIKRKITPDVVKQDPKVPLRGANVLYNSLYQYIGSSNDRSVVQLFRMGSFTVLSLGDCEGSDIRDRLMKEKILTGEVDVLILAHHGADNDFTTKEFLEAIKPKVAICASDYGNQYGHPSPKVVKLLSECNIDYYSTKTGDVIAQTYHKYKYMVSNYIANNEELKSRKYYDNKTWFENEDEPQFQS